MTARKLEPRCVWIPLKPILRSELHSELKASPNNTVRPCLKNITATTKHAPSSVPPYLEISVPGAKDIGWRKTLAWSRKPVQVLPGKVAVVQLQERKWSVLKVHKVCKQNKWNLPELVLIPCRRLISEKAFCVAIGLKNGHENTKIRDSNDCFHR